MGCPMHVVSYEQQQSIAYITLNRPEALNALNFDMLQELENFVDSIRIRAINVYEFGGGLELALASTLFLSKNSLKIVSFSVPSSHCYFYFLNFALTALIIAGSTEMTIIKISTVEKLSLIIGIFPKKYPISVQLITHKNAPNTL